MATTTSYAIRGLLATAIRGITPTLGGVLFVEHDNQLEFREWCEKNPASSFRRFSVRERGVAEPALVSNNDVEWREVDFEILIAYPDGTRYGNAAGVDMDRAMESDQDLIETAIGLRGSIANATVIRGGTSAAREFLNGVTVISIIQRMGHYRSFT